MNIVPPRVDNIPRELRSRPQWVAWTYKPDGGKLPLDAKTGRAASSADPATWCDFETAHRFARQQSCGVGYVFTADDGFCGIDFDDCRDPANGSIRVETWQQIERLNSYTEVSPSGRGVKVFCRAKLDRARKNCAVELYDRGRFFTVTGQHVPATPETLEARQAEVNALIRTAFSDAQQTAGRRGERILEHERNNTLTSLAGSMRRRGMSPEAIEAALLTENAERCDPPLADSEVRRIAASISRYEPVSAASETDLQKDYGHAAVLAVLFKGCYRWAAHRHCWTAWTGKVWRPVPEEAVAKAAADALRQHYAAQIAATSDRHVIQELSRKVAETCIYSRVTGALNFLRGWPGVLTLAEEWDRDPWLLNCENGTLNLKTFALQPHDPRDLCTKLAPVAYDPAAAAPRWQAHLETFLPDANVRRQVQRDLGLSLAGADLQEILPVWYGTGGNGKSTTLRVIQALLGDYAQMAAPRLLLASKYERHSTELAELCGRRLIFSAETGQGGRLDEERVKMLTGGERIRARFMREDNTEFERTWTIVLVTNHKPDIRGTDEGIWRRIRLVPWTVSLPREHQRPQEEVVSDLLAEGPAILAWLVAGLRDWQRDHAWVAEAVQVATNTYRQEQDLLAGFLADGCELGPRYTVTVGNLYDAYVAWAERNSEEPMNKNTFSKCLTARGLTRDRRPDAKGTRIWRGIKLLTDSDTDSIFPRESNFSRAHTESVSESVRSNEVSPRVSKEHAEQLKSTVPAANPPVGRCHICGVSTLRTGKDGKALCSKCAMWVGPP